MHSKKIATCFAKYSVFSIVRLLLYDYISNISWPEDVSSVTEISKNAFLAYIILQNASKIKMCVAD